MLAKRSGVARRRRRAASSRPVQLAFETLEDRTVPSGANPDASILGLQQNIQHIVVIYQENWSFDGLYGNFPGANGIANASPTSLTQIDRLTGQPYSSQLGQPFDLAYNGPALTTPPQPINNDVSPAVIDPRFPAGLNTLLPYDAGQFLTTGDKTGDIVHRFYQEQSQIDGGLQNKYITWSDNPGLVMSHFNATNLPEGLLAQQYTMDDNFFHSAYGGSFLNHQFLVSANAPVYPNAPSSMIATVDSTGQLALNPTTGKIVHDGNITPTTAQALANGFNGSSPFDKNYAINTIFSQNLVPPGSNPASPSFLPSQNDNNPNGPNYIQTIGDLLDGNGVTWKWYSGDFNQAVAVQKGPVTPTNPNGDPNYAADVAKLNADNFQWHHQPLAYYNNFAPYLPNGQRNPLSAAHLQDEMNLFADLTAGTLPQVSLIKQVGVNNEHPGYTDVLQGQQATAAIVQAIQNSSAWNNTAIIITYDENGGRWDHVAPPLTDINGVPWGDGTRVPAIVISPYAQRGFVDHTQHDTSSILKTIEEDFTHGQGLNNAGNLDTSASDLLNDFQFPGVNVNGSALDIVGSTAGDFVYVTPVGANTDGSTGVNILSVLNGKLSQQTFTQTFSELTFYFQSGGNDTVSVDPRITLPVDVNAGNGNNLIHGGSGNAVIHLGTGNNNVYLGNGNDTVTSPQSSPGIDSVTAGDGTNMITLGGKTNFVRLGQGNNNVTVLGTANNFIQLGGGNNMVRVGPGSTQVFGGDGNNQIALGDSDAFVMLGNGADMVTGGNGNDLVWLGNGNDSVSLGNGNDFVFVGTGHNTVSVGTGTDTLVVNVDDLVTVAPGGKATIIRRPRM
jgi:phospholipase C